MRRYNTIIAEIKKLGYVNKRNVYQFIDLAKELKENLEELKEINEKVIEKKLKSGTLTYKESMNYRGILEEKKIHLRHENEIDSMIIQYEQARKSTLSSPKRELKGEYHYCRHMIKPTSDVSLDTISNYVYTINKYIKYTSAYGNNYKDAIIGNLPIIVENTEEGLKDLITGKLINNQINNKNVIFIMGRKIKNEKVEQILNMASEKDIKNYEADMTWLIMELTKTPSITIEKCKQLNLTDKN